MNFNICLCIIPALLIMCACIQPKETYKPTVDEATMIMLLTEIYYLDSHFSILSSNIKDSLVQLKLNEMLLKHGISKEQFNLARNYYSRDEKAQLRLEEGIRTNVKNAGRNN